MSKADEPRVLLAALVHELRQPLFALKGRLQLAVSSAEPADAECILESVLHMESLLARYSGGESGALEPEQRFDLRLIVAQSLEMLAAPIAATGAEVVTHMPTDRVETWGRPGAVRQVVMNLLQNALEAVASQTDRRIEVRVSSHGERIELVVSDSGQGLAEAVQDRLFEPFVSTKELGRGGLGLFIANELVREANGTLTLDTQDSGGTRACMELPRTAPA